jgi:hypothetical protein
MLNYKRNGRRRLARPLKRLSDEAETGLSSHKLAMEVVAVVAAADDVIFER